MKNKRLKLFVLLLFLATASIPEAQTQTPDLSNWPEERIKQWEDSIKRVLYPDLEVQFRQYDPKANAAAASISLSPTAGIYAVTASNTFSNTFVPNTSSIDKSRDVGEIPVSSDVSPTGATIYNVPIEIYPGTGGCQPQLSLSYNSQGGNGAVGNGWSIGGLSVISRINKSLWYDGKSHGVLLSKEDALSLDGSRLIKTGETAWQIRYETVQGNTRVLATVSGDVISCFDVLYPNGSKGVYGYAGNSSNCLEYPLTSLSDGKGHTITFTYALENNHYRVTKIAYGGNAVDFEYAATDRTDPVFSYDGGLKKTENRLLQKIICKFGTAGTTLRTYELSYKTQRNISVLNRIDCKASSGKSFNPLVFYYGEGAAPGKYTKDTTKLSAWYKNAKPGQLILNKGKFDYGTEDDGLIVSQKKNPYWHHYRHKTNLRHSQNRYDNQYEGTENIFIYTGLSGDISWTDTSFRTGKNFIDIFCANVDGKYEEEIIKVNNGISGSNDQVIFNVYSANLYTGTGIAYKYTRTFNFQTVLKDADGGKSIHPKFYHTGDFNGDGKIEVLAVSNHHPIEDTSRTSKCYLFDLEADKILYEGYAFPYVVDFEGSSQEDPKAAFENTDRLFVLDYDGDGKSDICLINSDGVEIYTFDVSSSTYSMRKVSTYTGLKKADLAGKDLMVGEFNGDGKPDLLISPKAGAYNWNIYYSMGNGQFASAAFNTSTPKAKSDTDGFLLQDVNSDGLTDLIQYSSEGYFTYLSKNGIIEVSFSHNTGITSGSILIPTDINSRNYFHKLLALKDNVVSKYSFSLDDGKEKMLTGVVNSFGIVSKNYYSMLNEGAHGSVCNSFYTKGIGAVYPYENFQGPLLVTTRNETYFNGNRTDSTLFRYENAVIHKQGLGFSGFGSVSSTDLTRNRTVTREYDPYNYGILKKEDTPFSQTDYTFSVSNQSDKRVKITLSKKKETDRLTGASDSTLYQYDTYGNPTKETLDYGGNMTSVTDNTYSNSTDDASYRIGFLTGQTNTVKRGGQTFTKQLSVTYNTNSLPTSKTVKHNGSTVSYESFSYDDNGNVTKNEVKNYTSTTILTTSYEYDGYGRKTKETDPAGLSVSYGYDNSGNLSEQKYKEQKTTYVYDGFGRSVSQTNPDGTVAGTSYSWATGGTNELFLIKSSATGQPEKKTYYDAFGRKTRSSIQRYNNTETHTDYVYDAYGRLQKTSQPFSGGSASHWTVTAYDLYDRPTSITSASGNKTTLSYSGKSMTETKDGISSTKTYDNMGRLVSVADPAGTITHSLRPDGQPDSIVAPGNVTTSFKYDTYGRRTSMTDPSAGTRTYEYDVSGNIKKETNANSKTTAYEYDTCNRITKKTTPELTTTYTYDADGLLSSVKANNSTSTAYTYDAYGRPVTETETVPDGKWLKKTYSYNNGNVSSVQYASQSGTITTENYTYACGHLSEITNETASIWKLTAENVFGQPTAATTGSISRTYSYDAYNADGLLSSVKANNSTSTAYTYDAYGRPSTETDTVPDGKWLKKTYSYSNGNVSSVQYASQSVTITTENYTYACGHLSEIKNGTASIWKLTAENVFGQPTAATTGSISRTYSYDSYGIPTGRKSGVTSGDFQSFTYSFDASNGNLTSRKDNKANKQENLILLII
ncbi:Cell wall-associated polypeptide CWBP200 [Bacteroidales bacterium Barb7]|nr:Cell wall-associated polypeptide CWBP200 [Bacteroidales bacterium Barb7]